jgi:hypothetical protein
VIRRVAYRKALLAGVIGALAWEAVVRVLILLGLPLGDLVRFLGTMIVGPAQPVLWWPTGLILHASVGAIWAIFYAYFFWSTFEWRPALQGLVFSVIPIALAGLVMLPQLGWMHPLALGGEIPRPGLFGLGWGWGGPASIVLGHVIYGITIGILYTRPVGYPAARRLTLPVHG